MLHVLLKKISVPNKTVMIYHQNKLTHPAHSYSTDLINYRIIFNKRSPYLL